MKNGLVIYLSRDDSDIVTVFLIFCRYDYGKILPGLTVVDIGANIGVFSLYAASQGAEKVYAYEPSSESFKLLQKNVRSNGLEQTIFPHKAAIVGTAAGDIHFSRKSSVFNSIETCPENADDFEKVPALMFSEILANLNSVNICKIDCEGGEYDIILNSENAIFNQIHEFRIEYHNGPHQKLFDRFEDLGFKQRQFMAEDEGAGYLWLTKA